MILVAILSFLVVAWGVWKGNAAAMLVGMFVLAMSLLMAVTAHGASEPPTIRWVQGSEPGIQFGLRADGMVVWRKSP